jgi:hypothetical protein
LTIILCKTVGEDKELADDADIMESIDVPPKNPEIGSKDDKGKADDDVQLSTGDKELETEEKEKREGIEGIITHKEGVEKPEYEQDEPLPLLPPVPEVPG